MAERFIAEHGDSLRYVHNIGWHEWDGARWLLDEERTDLDHAVETVKNALRELEDLSGQERDDLYKDIRKSESASGLEGMVKIASSRKPISVGSKQLDADPYLFNTPTGTVHLLEGTVAECCREDLITKVAGTGLDQPEDAESDGGLSVWETFVERILPDPDVRSFVQRLFGYAMLGETREHMMPIFTGTGANGKSTMAGAIAEAFGDYAIEVDPALLMESKHERHGAFKMRLRGARLAFCSETEKGKKFSEPTMKRLVDGTPIEANLMHKNPIQFQPSHTLIMLTNHLPAVSGDDPAVWRRILVVPFDVVIPEAERDATLPAKLKAAAPAVLGWVYDGWLSYQDEGLNPPEAVRVRTQEYQAASDVLGRFLAERTIATPHGSVRARELYSEWVAWCHASGEQPGTEKGLAESLQNRGYTRKERNVGRVWMGLMLAGNDNDDD
ncbi:phage/plasmid primase, P4 family [Streptomyces sp. NPDC093595]|uniref:DNA primase family protein n=1 Tax=Streptomyces sp. NPDC093595 TaxID=3366045 RepID=UPI0038052A7B